MLQNDFSLLTRHLFLSAHLADYAMPGEKSLFDGIIFLWFSSLAILLLFCFIKRLWKAIFLVYQGKQH